MTARKNERHDSDELRRRAEDINRENSVQTPEIMEALSPEAERRLLDELRVHQFKLEMQNEELRRMQSEMVEVCRSAGIQDVLREIADAMVRAQSLDEFYQTIHHLTERVLPEAQFHVSLLDEEAGEVVSVYGADEENILPKRRPLGKGLAEYTMRLGHAVHITPTLLRQLIETGEYTLWRSQNQNARQSLCAPLIDSKGKPFGMISLISTSDESFFKPIDVETLLIIAAQISMAIEYKRVEAALVEERNLLRTLIDRIPDRIFVKDRQSRFVLNNTAHIDVLGAHSQSEVLGKTGHAFRPAAYANRHLEDDRIVMENDKPLYNIEEPTILPSGETGTLLISKTPLHNEAGEVIGLVGISRDITEQKRVQESERRSNKTQNILHEIAETAVLAASLNELYVKVHQMVNQVLPTKNFFIALVDEAVGEIVVPYCVDETNSIPQRRPIGKGMTEYAMRQGQTVHLNAAELDQLWKTGDINLRFVNEWLGAPLKNSAGKIFGVIALFSTGDAQPYEPECAEVLSIIAAQVSMTIERKQVEQALRESEALYFALVQNSSAGIVLRDESGIITYANDTFARMMQADDPSELLGRSYLECVHPEDRAGSLRRFAANVTGTASPLREHRLVGLQGRMIFVESTGVPITKGGRPYVMGVFHDVTDRKRAEDALRENEERFRSFVENANDIVYSLTLKGIFTYVSPNWTEILGHETSEIIGHSFADFVHPDDHPIGNAFLERMLVTGEKQGGLMYRIQHKNGEWRWHTINATPMRDATGKIVSFLGIGRDITEGKRMEEELQYQATTDGLTGIFNRRYFLTRADEELQRIQRFDGTCSLLMLDIDHFKMVNDEFGHAVGDTTLQWITIRCREATRSMDLVGRIGGEEFAILLLETGISGAKRVAERLRQSIRDTAFRTAEGIQIPLRVSIGIAEHLSKSESLSELMARADKALYRAKNEREKQGRRSRMIYNN